MKLDPFVSVDQTPFTASMDDVLMRHGAPTSTGRNGVGLHELDYGSVVYRFQDCGRLEEVTVDAPLVRFGDTVVPFDALADFVRSRPAQPLASFLQQSNAVLTHDVSTHLERITAPTLITFGRTDQVTSTRFADPMSSKIRNAEVFVFEGCSHAPIYEKVEEFNERSLQFLQRHTG